MPKIVDHDQRRNEIVEAFLAVVARDGLPAATSRAIAAELGMGAGALWHYFDGFDAVAAGAFHRITDRTNDRIAAATASRRGLAALDAALREILPLEKETRDEAHVVVGFWGRMAANDTMPVINDVVEDQWRGMLRDRLAEAVEDGDIDPAVPYDEVIDVLLSIALAQQVHAVMGSPLSEPARQLAMIDHCLRPWRRAARS
ncbi:MULTISPECIES: TetR family transcriptional regulator C-terminal domain-containing protein [Actinoplanes]|uniref:TetR/AcrR family transcriptional regulator n=1 Tax=Actinoplanes TaxID=1865 RepID=UPI0005F2A362|nr:MULTISPECIES: TetR family transcriptional regulator C-terminal domain-containing protein [Actinoplanes]GLY02574.1 TetR family transcriptional regulator [Actinoplanes sp. NBRC 101535]